MAAAVVQSTVLCTVLCMCVTSLYAIDQAHFVAKRPILIKVIKNYPLLPPPVAVDTPVRYDEPLRLSVEHSSSFSSPFIYGLQYNCSSLQMCSLFIMHSSNVVVEIIYISSFAIN